MEFADFNLPDTETSMTEMTEMTEMTMLLIEILRKHNKADFLRAVSEGVSFGCDLTLTLRASARLHQTNGLRLKLLPEPALRLAHEMLLFLSTAEQFQTSAAE